jgi:hypothetical protein
MDVVKKSFDGKRGIVQGYGINVCVGIRYLGPEAIQDALYLAPVAFGVSWGLPGSSSTDEQQGSACVTVDAGHLLGYVRRRVCGYNGAPRDYENRQSEHHNADKLLHIIPHQCLTGFVQQ